MIYKCDKCNKTFYNMEEYNKETKDVPTGFQWIVEHKDEYCKKVN